jgi:hypothetical protein
VTPIACSGRCLTQFFLFRSDFGSS